MYGFPVQRGQMLDGDIIAREIFAATRRAGRPDTFLSQELADGVLHFLRALDKTASPQEIRETAVAAIRSLGHPTLASFVGESFASVVEDPEQRSDESIYPPNLIAAETAGLITIGDKDHPTTLTGGLLDPPAANTRVVDWMKRLLDARMRFERFVVFDEVERHVADSDPTEWLESVCSGLLASGLLAVIHLNRPARADAMPLFAPAQPTFWPEAESDLSLRLLSAARQMGRLPIRWVWHLNESNDLLAEAMRLTCMTGGLTIVGERPRSAPWLATGLPAGCPAVIQQTGMSLTALREYLSERGDEGPFEDRCNSLARLALATGNAKKRFLRAARPDLQERFIVDRSCLALHVDGLDRVSDGSSSLRRAIIDQLESACRPEFQLGSATLVLPEVRIALADIDAESPMLAEAAGSPLRMEMGADGNFHADRDANKVARVWTSSKAANLRLVWPSNTR
ncbi:MAG: hypothetical protein K1X57_04360 [Gemmataceae bacterium]|nr:hypothetical protein [Gemmataceae bacterium]